MENATHAMKIIFGVVVFSIAIGLSFNMFGKLKTAQDTIINAKAEGLYNIDLEYKNENPILNQKRIIGKEIAISSMFDYYKSGYKIYLRKGNFNKESQLITNISDVNLYKANTMKDLNYLDFEEEKNRKELWISSDKEIKNHLNILMYGGTYNGTKYDGLLNNDLKGNKKILEEISKKIESNGIEKTIIYYTII